MRRALTPWIVLVVLLGGAGLASLTPADDAEDTVLAKRYRTWVFGPEARHGYWIEELYFPEKGICANLEWRTETKGDSWDFVHLLNAFYGPMRNRFTTSFHEDTKTESPVEDVKVPAALAKRIYEAADLHRRLEQTRREIGTDLFGAGFARDLDPDGKPRESVTLEPAPK